MSTQARQHLTPWEYLARERQAEAKSEYFNGEVFAMSGASRKHNLICVNIAASLHQQLQQRPCEVYVGDMRVKVNQIGLYTYPDVVVACGAPQFEDAELDTLLNPIVIIEVLSASTEDYDRGRKFEHYRTLPSLQEYVLVAQDSPHLTHYVRQADDTWVLSDIVLEKATLMLPSIQCHLLMRDVYAKIATPASE
jgi:Uma2 family endonuclease